MNYRNLAKDYNDVFNFNVIPLVDKVPNLEWTKWQKEEMELNDIDTLGWNARVNGIGAIAGINGLRCLDFDDVKDPAIVFEMAEILGLEKNYEWIVKSGSGKGYHIWFICEDDENYIEGLGKDRAYYKFKPKKLGSCDHLELRWNSCQTVLPPSLHPSGKQYQFMNVNGRGLPISGPKEIWSGKLIEGIKKTCILEEREQKIENRIQKSERGLKEYEKRLLEDAVQFIKGSIDNYDDWLRIGFAFASLGEAGRKYFIEVSKDNPKYKDSESDINKKYDKFLKDYNGEITLGTFFEIAKNYGWERPRKHFWRIDNDKAKIIVTELIELLEEDGFGKMFIGKMPMFVRVNDNIVSEVSNVVIKDHVLNYLREAITDKRLKKRVMESVVRGAKTYFSDSTLECLPTLDLSFVRDTKDNAFFFFENCFVEVTKDEIVEKSYCDLSGHIWDGQQIKRKFVKGDSQTVYRRFIENICGHDSKRISALCSAIGYLLHRYKDPSNPKAIIFLEEVLSDRAEGRTGKGLVVKGIKQIRNVVKEDGKNFKFDSTFAFQKVNPDTDVVYFDDVGKKFPFENLFSILTDGITVEKKNKNAIYIEPEDTPKIVITTNYAIQGSNDSAKDRQFVIEFKNFYSAKHKPIDDFGKNFFTDWDEKEFSKFDNFMLECCQLYLMMGLMKYEHVNLLKKTLCDETCPEFEEFIRDIELNVEHNKREMFEQFREEYPDFEKLRQNTFTKWTKTYANLYELDVDERKSGKDRFIKIVKKEEG